MRLEIENETLRDISPTAIRMPSAIKEKIREVAKENNRSMSAEIVARLEDSFQNEQSAKAAYELGKSGYVDNYIESRPEEIQRTLMHLYNRVMYLRTSSGIHGKEERLEMEYLESEIKENEKEFSRLMEIINK